MPLKITPPAPFVTDSQLPVSSVYAIIDQCSYARRGLVAKCISATIGYYANDAASLVSPPLNIAELPFSLSQEATPEQANSLPLFEFLEALLQARLEAALPEGTLFEKVS